MNEKLQSIFADMDAEDVAFYHSLQKIKITEAGTASDTCVICYSTQLTIFEEPLKCGHRFHSECINEWKNYSKKCPFCQKPID